MNTSKRRAGGISFGAWICFCVLLAPVPGAAAGDDGPRPGAAAEESGALASSRRRVLFGELHLHTSYSFDAFGFSPSRIDPDTAYRFARGEAVDYLGKPARRHAPLDFMAVTDHAEYMGFLNTIED
ncbi:MAG TPA: DUF3604 domain-containing protein, partial [Pseudomonadales bacterium]|nr:DUF3604 domain-containing protein [Pseudomonadales bacterium]